VGGWTQDRLPPTLQGRVRLGGAHLAVVALLVAVAVGGTSWWLLRAGAGGTELPDSASPAALFTPAVPEAGVPGVVPGSADVTPGASAAAPTSGASSGPATGSAGGTVVVDVAGKVRRPGIATLPLGSRVVDALEAAGGTRRGVRLGSLNLARLLTDGEQILVGQSSPAGVAASAVVPSGGAVVGGPAALVNLNTASQVELEELPGVGPVTAQKILVCANGPNVP